MCKLPVIDSSDSDVIRSLPEQTGEINQERFPLVKLAGACFCFREEERKKCQKNETEWAMGVAQLVEILPSIHEAPALLPEVSDPDVAYLHL